MLSGKRILVGVLNWGLGHASRSVQLIKQLERLDAELIIASDGQALSFLREEFPGSTFFQLPELKVHYASVFGLQWSILSQIPKFLQAMKSEKDALENFLKAQELDCIISDNRYGLYHSDIPSILLTHQLSLQLKFAKRKADAFMRELVSNFDEVWVPDEEGALLSGQLSQLENLPIKKYYMGSMSHLSRLNISEFNDDSRDSYLAILSGPEPLRSHFEDRLVSIAEHQRVPIKIIRGTQQLRKIQTNYEYVEFKDWLSTKEILEATQNHLGVICRSGYSSLMDLSWLKRRALFIPTPGQVEQEYLSKYHLESRHFYSQQEKKLDLKRDLEEAFGGKYLPPQLGISIEEQGSLMTKRFTELFN